MKFAVRGVLIILVLIAGAIFSLAVRASRGRHADEAYHAVLAKTVAVSSRSFAAKDAIPSAFTCQERGISPHIQWDHVPAGTQSYVLTMVDWDAPTPLLPLNDFTHWILYNIPEQRREVSESASNDELRKENIDVGHNSSGSTGYAPPCPPLGKHLYKVRVYAIDIPQIRPSIADRSAIQNAMQGHILGFGEIVGIVGR
jgi:Raf kinase inhibitor-like YbhB/YbcL family protein